MTGPGKTLALCALLAALGGAAMGSRPTITAALALAFLLAADGLMWLLMCRAAGAFKAARTMGPAGDRATAFAGHAVEVTVKLAASTRLRVPLAFRDLVPRGLTVEGDPSFAGEADQTGAARLSYRVRADGLALFRFPGVVLTIASPAGLFRTARHLEAPGALRVVPDIFAKHFLQPWRKGINTLLRHGRHMQRRAGFGAELLALRAYQEGDALKSIAWRASARRDELLVKEFENEVPVRARIVLAPSTRLHAGAAPPVTRAAVFCARLARLLAEQRDLVEVVIPRPDGVVRTGLGLTRRHLGAVLAALGEAASRPAPAPLPLAPGELEALLEAARCAAPALAEALRIMRRGQIRFGLSAAARREARAALALFLSARFDLGPGAPPLLIRDDALLGFFGRAFMPDAPSVPAGDLAWAWAAIEAPGLARRLSDAIERLTARAEDEELFVVMADLAILPDDGRPRLVDTLAYARARGHRAVVYWPEIPPPEGPWRDFLAAREASLAAARARLRARGIPALAFTAEDGFLPLLGQLALLRRARGALRC